jgi:hypothetical protein
MTGPDQPAADVIEVEISEMVTYRNCYARAELVALLLREKGFPLNEAELAQLTDAELAQIVRDERPGTIEEALQRYGNVDGSEWLTRVLPAASAG